MLGKYKFAVADRLDFWPGQMARPATGPEVSPSEAPSKSNFPSASATDGNSSTTPIESEKQLYAD
jgi:hypothetical protein